MAKVAVQAVTLRKSSRNFVLVTDKKISQMKDEIRQYYDNNGYLSWSERRRKYVILGTNRPANGLVGCPQCKIGMLMVIRSRQTGKRFLGCSNYHNGCRASSPLIQKGMMYATKIPCKSCLFPMILLRYSVRQKWTRQCGNITCPSRKVRS
ncbi:MAG TPA: DNA topoisomerase [Candidatus Nitrosotalea sp.]|nr:DNA topoisomerase [Candidatus Nitrosotalea sp.]